METNWNGSPELDGPKVDASGKKFDTATGKLKIKAGKLIVKGLILTKDLGYITDLKRIVFFDKNKGKAEFHFKDSSLWKIKEKDKGELYRFVEELQKGLEVLSVSHEIKKSESEVVEVVGGLIVIFLVVAFFWWMFSGSENEGEMPDITPQYKIVTRNEDFSYAGVDRKGMRITVPQGLSQKELEDNLKHAIWLVYNESKPDALQIDAYREGDPTNGAFTAGKAVLAPNGKWEDAALDDPLKVTLTLAKLYFMKPEPTIPIGSKVKLKDSSDPELGISKKFEAWNEEDLIIKIPNGTSAEIVKVKKIPLGTDYEMVRYLVKVNFNEKSYEGWVHDHDIVK